MSALFLDDIGLSLFHDAHEALESLLTHIHAPTMTAPVLSFLPFQGETNNRDRVYIASVNALIRHLEFMCDTPSYAERCIYQLEYKGIYRKHDVMLMLNHMSRPSTFQERYEITKVIMDYKPVAGGAK